MSQIANWKPSTKKRIEKLEEIISEVLDCQSSGLRWNNSEQEYEYPFSFNREEALRKAKTFNPLTDYQPCKTCGGLFKKEKMKSVQTGTRTENRENPRGRQFFSITAELPEFTYYCIHCAPAYDRVADGKYYKNSPEIEVDVKGRKIKSK